MPVITGKIQWDSSDVLMYFYRRGLDFGNIIMNILIKIMLMKNLNFFTMVMMKFVAVMVGKEIFMLNLDVTA